MSGRTTGRGALVFWLVVAALCMALVAPRLVLATPNPSAALQAGLGTVVIDAGHQGTPDSRPEPIGPGSSQTKPRVESGAEGVVTHAPESQINLDVALKLEETLEALGVNVVMVRTSQNVDISNSQRAEIANGNHAALFIRLHCDGVSNSSTHGLLMLRPGSNQWTGPIVAPSKTAADYVDKSTLTATGAYDRGTQTRTDLSGFNWSKVPAILVEMGVMSNPAEDRKLSTSSYQQTLADGMATGIVEYLKSVHRVSAGIDSVSPSPATTDTSVAFTGHASDPAHAITAWQWRSTIDGVLATVPSFTKKLSIGIHAIYLKAMCSQGMWSPEVGTWLVVGATGTKPLPVYRFYNRKTGVHFYTASEAEMNSVASKLAATYSLEGVAYAIDASAAANNAPLYRFYNVKQGVHFYTASEAEKNNVISTLGKTYHYDGVAFDICPTPTGGAQPVYRFYNFKKGVHFYTASLAERDDVVARLGQTYRCEGIAYYYVRPW